MRRRFVRVLVSAGIAGLLALPATNAGASTTWNIGDVYVGVAGGSYQVYDNNGVFKETISDGSGGFTTGCAFNGALDKLYTTSFSLGNVPVYADASPHAIVQTIPTRSPPESIVFAANGHFFVGGPSGGAVLQEFDAAGSLVDTDTLPSDGTGGPDWIDLAADQSTMFYASEGRDIQRFDVASDTPLANFATLPGSGSAFALRLLPPGDGTGGLLVADGGDVKRLDGAGVVVQTYDVAGEDGWFALNLDPNGTSFWSGDFGTANFYRFNIASGAVELGPINTGTGGFTLFGICLKGEQTAALPQITLDPPSAVNEAGTDHTVTATISAGGNPVPNELVTFTVVSGPNTGEVSDPGECSVNPACTTDANGQTSWTYTGAGGAGTDVIEACFVDAGQTRHCARAEKVWEVTRLDLALDPPTAENEAGTDHSVTATVTRGGQPVAGELVSFAVVSGPNAGQASDPGECTVDPNCFTDANGNVSWTYTSNGQLGQDVIEACITQSDGTRSCVKAEKRWVDTTAPEAACTETTNPHGQTVPPAGSTTLPGSKGGQNEDGFYRISARDAVDPNPTISLVDSGTGFVYPGPFSSGMKIKYTEANGATPSQKKMGSSNGQADAVDYHLTGQGDLVLVATDASGNSTKATCLVPPPPK